LFAHDPEFELHAAPDTSQIDAHYTIVVIAWRVGGFCENILDSCVVMSGIQSSERGNGLFHHRFDLRIVRHVTGNSQRLVPLSAALEICHQSNPS